MSKSLVAATSGALAACASTVAVFPLDTLLVHHQASVSKQPRTLLQHQQKRHRSVLQALIDALQELLQQEDAASVAGSTPKTRRHKSTLTDLVNRISRLYSGLGIKLAEQVARNFVYFYFRAAKRFGSLGTAGTLLMAVLAALGTQLLTAPLDVTSTHAQLCRLPLRTIFLRILRTEGDASTVAATADAAAADAATADAATADAAALLHVLHCGVSVATGPWGFYRGFGAALCLCANPAITNATFDSLKLWLQMVNLLRSRRFMDPITDDDTPVERFGVLLQARLLERGAKMHGSSDSCQQEHQELALISGGTGSSSTPWHGQQQQQTKVPRALSVQSALDRELQVQLIAAAPTSAYICSDNLRKPASFCLSDCRGVSMPCARREYAASKVSHGAPYTPPAVGCEWGRKPRTGWHFSRVSLLPATTCDGNTQ
ncbi:uncharacterized protein LOC34622021 [Cyclospora cayetanensis]|uniref:Uncharacterized protein LOC34622021 n=1 Tax=Cyclospora cayetanensis TaxID=88456 RepID=A0A6P6RWR3_9EIME|nr:uncharacterized protein LOC34622021 [Cyclospora cayetanensis]